MTNGLQNQIFRFFENEENYKKVYRTCLYFFGTPDEAKDATQEVFLKLANKAEKNTINFPENRDEALRFVRRVVINHFYERFRKLKGSPTLVGEDEAILVEDSSIHSSPNAIRKLEQLNKLILMKKNLFTKSQLELWDCMYEFNTVEQIMLKLGKEEQTIHSLRNKLRNKIRKHFSFKDLM